MTRQAGLDEGTLEWEWNAAVPPRARAAKAPGLDANPNSSSPAVEAICFRSVTDRPAECT